MSAAYKFGNQPLSLGGVVAVLTVLLPLGWFLVTTGQKVQRVLDVLEHVQEQILDLSASQKTLTNEYYDLRLRLPSLPAAR